MLNTKIKFLLASCCLTLWAANVYATAPGLYLGLMAGLASNKASSAAVFIAPLTIVSLTPNKNQFGGRLYVGYDINSYFGFEGGYTYFSKVNYGLTGSDIDLCGGTNARVSTIDLLLKGMLPIQSFSLFAKAGINAAFIKTSGALASNNPLLLCGKSTSTTNFKPTFAIGAGYDLTQNWVLDVSYNRVYVGEPINSLNFYAIGISYHFVNKYCGQFLCDD